MNNKNTLMDNVRRWGVRIGLEVLQGLNTGNVAQPEEDEVPENIEESRNIPYVNRQGIPLAMDIFKPTGPEYEDVDLPVIVSIHGGGLVTGDRKISQNLGRELASRGYLVFAIEYRLAPRASVCEQFDDVCSGMDFVVKNLVNYDADYTRMFLTADSAGAFLAVYTAAMRKSKKLQAAIGYEPSSMVFQALGLSCGMFYTNYDDILGALMSEQFYGDKKDDSNFLQFMNPEHPEIINNLPPTFLVTSHGDFLNRYTIGFEKALQKAGNVTKMLYYGEAELNHTFNFAHPDYPQSKDANDKMLEFFEQQAARNMERQATSREQQRRLNSIEKRLQEGGYGKQRLYKTIFEINSVSEETLDAMAVKDDYKGMSYRQLFHRWDQYAEVFSGLGMTGKDRARVGFVGASTKEAIYSFFALNKTGAAVSLLPGALLKDERQLFELIKSEELTDLILTDHQTSPKLLDKIMKNRPELGLRNVIILESDVCKPGADEEEIRRAAGSLELLKRIPDVLFMPQLLVRFEAFPIVAARGESSKETILLHRRVDSEGKYETVGFTEEEINARILRLARPEEEREENGNLQIGLTADLSASWTLVDQMLVTLYTGNCLILTHNLAENKAYLKAAGEHYINRLYLYDTDLKRLMASSQGMRIKAAALDEIRLLAEELTAEDLEAYESFFREYGGSPSITLYTDHDKDYSYVAEKAREKKTAGKPAGSAALPPLPYMPFVPSANALSGGLSGGSGMGDILSLLTSKEWVDVNGGRHDLVKLRKQIRQVITMLAENQKKPGEEAPEPEPNADAAALQKLMKILSVLFQPIQVDYYFED